MKIALGRISLALAIALATALTTPLFAASNGETVAIDATGLKPLGEAWLKENPYWSDPAMKDIAIKIGSSGYNQNCARCHGLEVISGGLAPDLRYLELNKDGDEWFLERIRGGYAQNGVTKMPKFEGIFSQEAMWAIRSFLASKHEE